MNLKTIFTATFLMLIMLASGNMDSNHPAYSQKNKNAGAGELNKDEWKFQSQRDALAPVHSIENNKGRQKEPALVLAGGGKDFANGGWVTVANVAAGNYYRFRVHYKATKVEQPWRSVFSSIVWMDEKDKQVGSTEFPQTLEKETGDGWYIMEQNYLVPEKASKARLELGYRWDPDGSVRYSDFSFDKINKPAPRNVKLATVLHRPQNSKGVKDNLEQFAALIDKAARQDADIICLPEAMTLIGTGLSYISAAETVPGPTTHYLGELAKKHNMYIVAGILEKEGEAVYNTAILLDRNGEFAGKYRKVSLPREEIEGGVTPGEETPVFDTDFGRIGIMICWDIQFPEVARSLALQGAEVILVPVWGGNITLTKARAIENQVYLVTSTYDMVSAVFDMRGEILNEASASSQVSVTEVDLNERIYWSWIGDKKNRIPRELPSRKSTVW